jgi:hypothetical protein
MAEPGLLSVRFFAKPVGSRMDCGTSDPWERTSLGSFDWSLFVARVVGNVSNTKQMLCPLTDTAAD